jgi:hypothetical protein
MKRIDPARIKEKFYGRLAEEKSIKKVSRLVVAAFAASVLLCFVSRIVFGFSIVEAVKDIVKK